MFKCKHDWRFAHSNSKGNWLHCGHCGQEINAHRLEQLQHAASVRKAVSRGRQERGEMTKQQADRVEWLRRQIILHDGNSLTGSEYKQFEVKVQYGLVFVYSVVGMPNDEGTMASIFCRTRRHISIGTQGGMRLLNAKDKKVVTGAAVLYTVTI